jgi:hypothetical protein
LGLDDEVDGNTDSGRGCGAGDDGDRDKQAVKSVHEIE